MMKRVRSFLSACSLSTPTTEIETVTNPMPDIRLIAVSKYDPLQVPCSLPEKYNIWETMSDISDDPEVLQINHEEEDNIDVEPTILEDQVERLRRSNSLLLMTPTTRLSINKSGVFSPSPDGVENLDVYLEQILDDHSASSGLSPIIM